MDLNKCPICGEEYSPSYRRCPFCEEMRSGRPRRGGHRVADTKHTYSARGALIVILVLVLALLGWYLFGDKLLGLFADDEPVPPIEDVQNDPPSNEDLFFDPDIGSEDEPDVPDVSDEPNGGEAPVVEEPPVVEDPEIDLDALKLSTTDFTATIGESVRVRVEPEVEGVSWSVKDAAVASVSADGVVKGLSVGQTTVYAKVGDRTLECIVRVKGASTVSTAVDVSNAKLSKDDFTLGVGERYTVKVNGTSATPTWSIDDSSIASISSDGTVKALKKGHTNFYAKVGDKTLKGIVFVK